MPYLQSILRTIQLALKNIVIMSEFAPYASAKGLIPDRQFSDIFHLTESSRTAFDKLT